MRWRAWERLRALVGRLPRPSAAQPQRGARAAVEPPAAAEASDRVLVVDDDALYREVAQILLEDAGLEVDAAADGPEALRLARAGGYALVLMDVQMPGMDGLETTRRLRQLPACGELPIIGMSANARTEDPQRCLDAGMNDFLAKPFHAQSLVATVQRWCPVRPGKD